MDTDDKKVLEKIEQKLDKIIEILYSINANMSPKNVELLLESPNINCKKG